MPFSFAPNQLKVIDKKIFPNGPKAFRENARGGGVDNF